MVDVIFPTIEKFDALPAPKVDGPTALISVMEGCSKYCSFCVVPYTRGPEVSRPVADVMREVVQLARQGVREITFLGQNVNAYRGDIDGDHADLAELLHYAADVPGIDRLRYTTSHPVEFGNSLIEAYATLPQLVSHVHLPVQSGSDRVLALMKRGHTILEYKDKIRRVRAVRPDVSLTSDFIVGFPGETDKDFEATLRLVEELALRHVVHVRIQPAARHAGGDRCPIRRRPKSNDERLDDVAGADAQAGRCVQPGDGRHDAARARDRACEKGSGSDAGPHREQPGRQFQPAAAPRCRDSSSTSSSPKR